MVILLATQFDGLFFCVAHLPQDPPQIEDAHINETTHELSITWTPSSTSLIINFIVMVTSTVTGKRQSAVVGYDETYTVSFIVDSEEPHNVTIIAYDMCQGNSSVTHAVDGIGTVTSLMPSSTPGKCDQQSPNRGVNKSKGTSRMLTIIGEWERSN